MVHKWSAGLSKGLPTTASAELPDQSVNPRIAVSGRAEICALINNDLYRFLMGSLCNQDGGTNKQSQSTKCWLSTVFLDKTTV